MPMTCLPCFLIVKGGAFLDLAVHEDEALRLWRDLGLVEHDKVGGLMRFFFFSLSVERGTVLLL